MSYRSNRPILLLTLFLLILGPVASPGAHRCDQVLTTNNSNSALSVHWGTEEEPSENLRSLAPRGQFRFLGRGGSGSVYRVISESEKSFILKEYVQDFGAKSDFEALKFLGSEVLSETSSFRVPNELSLITPVVMKMEDVRGRTLISILRDPQVDENYKARLLEKYNTEMEDLISRLVPYHHPSHELEIERSTGRPTMVSGFLRSTSGTHYLWLKPDNVIVDVQSHRPFVMVDPF